MSQGGRVFLFGAGCSKCAGLPLTSELTDKVLASDKIGAVTKEILNAIRVGFEGSSHANIEDYLSELVDLLAIADRRAERLSEDCSVALGESSYERNSIRTALTEIKCEISEIISVEVNPEFHCRLARVLHQPLRPGKSGTERRVDYLVLNYDTLVEDALALERVRYSDGMDGGRTGWWQPSLLSQSDLDAKVLKLHGSIDWCRLNDNPFPRRLNPQLSLESDPSQQIVIWPAATKYRETQIDPYAELLDRARYSLTPIRNDQRVLVVLGYSFGDSHINIEIDRALRSSNGNLTVAAFTPDKSPSGQLQEWHGDPDVSRQVLIFCNNGFFHGDVEITSATDLLWWKFENLVRLLEGQR